MTEIFNGLVVIGDVIDKEDHVVYLLASLPDSYIIKVSISLLRMYMDDVSDHVDYFFMI